MITPSGSTMNGGRFDFDDGGTYCGGWEEGKAHGHGVCTGPKSQGEYSGAWHYGFEVSGVYTWPSGNSYEGQWQNGKRHGLGVERRGRWAYKGEWTQGYKGRYGVRYSTNSSARFEGTWANGLQDGYGQETYADGGTYQGQWMRGMRHGYGVRKSAQYNIASKYRSRTHAHASLTSLRSDQSEENDDKQTGRSPEDSRGGFVLRARSEAPSRRRSLSERSLAVKRTILQGLRIKKQRSTGDIDQKGQPNGMKRAGSVTSFGSDESSNTGGGGAASSGHHKHRGGHEGTGTGFFPAEEFVDPNAVETYIGEWKNDKRSGFGVSERSDGLKYEGEWFGNKKFGYGVTTFKDGTKEEGKYKNNVLITSQRKKHLLFVRTSKLRERIDNAVGAAQRAVQIALQKADIGVSRSVTARERADQADVAALQAREDAEVAKVFAKQLSPEFNQTSIDPYKKIQMEVANHVLGISPKQKATAPISAEKVRQQQHQSSDYFTQVCQQPVQQQQQQATLTHPVPVSGPTCLPSPIDFTNLPPGVVPQYNSNMMYENLLLKMAAQQQQYMQAAAAGQNLSFDGSGQFTVGGLGGVAQQPSIILTQQNPYHQQQHQLAAASVDQHPGISQHNAQNVFIPVPQQQQQPVHQLVGNDIRITRTDEKQTTTSGPYQDAYISGVSTASDDKKQRPVATTSAAVDQTLSKQTLTPPKQPNRPNLLQTQRSPSSSQHSVNSQPYDLYDFYSTNKLHGQPYSKSFDQSTTITMPSTSKEYDLISNLNNRRSTAGPDSHLKTLFSTAQPHKPPLSNVLDKSKDIDVMEPSTSIHFADRAPPASSLPKTCPRGSEPDIKEILRSNEMSSGSHQQQQQQQQSGLLMTREEIARLSSQRRQELQRLREEEELIQNNALARFKRQLYNPRMKAWIMRYKLPLLMLLFNICLSILFCHLLAYPKRSSKNQPSSDGDNS